MPVTLKRRDGGQGACLYTGEGLERETRLELATLCLGSGQGFCELLQIRN